MKLLILCLFITSQALAIDSPLEGWQLLHGGTKKVSVWGECKDITNLHASSDYFSPTKIQSEWNAFKASTPAGLIFTDGNCYSSCKAIKDVNPMTPSGVYFINPTGGPAAGGVSTYCDMVTDGGGWTMVFKATGADQTDSFHANSGTSYWLNPANQGNPVDFTNVTVFDSSLYQSHKVQDIMIRSLTDSGKRLTWSMGGNSDSLKWMIDQKRRMLGRVTAGSITSLDYRAGCDIGTPPVNPYVGIYPSDEEPAPSGNVVVMNNTITFTGAWMASIIGWGTPPSDYVPGTNMSGGFGSLNRFGGAWNLSRHVHGIGNGCNGGEWGGSGLMGTQTMNGHALFVRAGTYKKSCNEILTASPGTPSGIYTIDPDGNGSGSFHVYCDMTTDGGGWTRVFAQDTSEGYMNATTAYSSNGTNPYAKNYSILDQLENFRSGGVFTLKINWPGYAARNIWSQTTNPTVDQPVAGYSAIAIDSSSNFWGGLERNSAQGFTDWFMDGSVNHSNWFYAIGAYSGWGSPGGIPASDTVAGSGTSVSRTELWVK